MARNWHPASKNAEEFDRQFEAALAAASEADASEARAESAAFHPANRSVSVRLRGGVEFGFPVARYPELAAQADALLEDVRVTASGQGLHWDAADVHLSVPNVVAELFGPYAARQTGRTGGRSRSEAKTAAARRNASLGGRPAKRTELQPEDEVMRVHASAGQQRRYVEIRVGGDYVVEPMNPAARRNRGRAGTVIGIRDVKEGRVEFRFHDTRRVALVDPSDLLPLSGESSAAD